MAPQMTVAAVAPKTLVNSRFESTLAAPEPRLGRGISEVQYYEVEDIIWPITTYPWIEDIILDTRSTTAILSSRMVAMEEWANRWQWLTPEPKTRLALIWILGSHHFSWRPLSLESQAQRSDIFVQFTQYLITSKEYLLLYISFWHIVIPLYIPNYYYFYTHIYIVDIFS